MASKKNASTEEAKNYIYIGPTLPKGLLKAATLIQGTRAQVEEYAAPATEFCPEVLKLIVPTDELAEANKRLKKPGALSARYRQVENAIAAARRKE
jgi:hypothetical protein